MTKAEVQAVIEDPFGNETCVLDLSDNGVGECVRKIFCTYVFAFSFLFYPTIYHCGFLSLIFLTRKKTLTRERHNRPSHNSARNIRWKRNTVKIAHGAKKK